MTSSRITSPTQSSRKQHHQRNRGDRQLRNLQKKIEVALSLMIESQEYPSATRTVLAAAMQRSAWEDINDTKRRSYAVNQSYKLDPRNDFDNRGLLSPEEEQKVRNGRQNGKGKAKVQAGNFPGDSSNHRSNAAMEARVAE